MSPLLAQMSLKMLSTVGPLIWRPSCMSMVLRTRRAIADWTTFVRSRQSIQLQHYQLCVKNLSAIRYTLSPESTLLLSNHISLQSPKITHSIFSQDSMAWLRRCHGCGSSVTSEWRTGPDGPDSLCDICGVSSIYLFPGPSL